MYFSFSYFKEEVQKINSMFLHHLGARKGVSLLLSVSQLGGQRVLGGQSSTEKAAAMHQIQNHSCSKTCSFRKYLHLIHSLFFLNPLPFFYFCYIRSLIVFIIYVIYFLKHIHLSASWANPKISVMYQKEQMSVLCSVLVWCYACLVFFPLFSRSFFLQPLV